MCIGGVGVLLTIIGTIVGILIWGAALSFGFRS
jgi:hypothetical protein